MLTKLHRSVKVMLADDFDVAFAIDGMKAIDKEKKWFDLTFLICIFYLILEIIVEY